MDLVLLDLTVSEEYQEQSVQGIMDRRQGAYWVQIDIIALSLIQSQ